MAQRRAVAGGKVQPSIRQFIFFVTIHSGSTENAEKLNLPAVKRPPRPRTQFFVFLVCFFLVLWSPHTQMVRARVGGAASGTGTGLRLRPGLAKLEQWLVGFPGRVLIRRVGSKNNSTWVDGMEGRGR